MPDGPLFRSVTADEVATLLQVMIGASFKQQSFWRRSRILAARPSGCGACVEWDGETVCMGTADCKGYRGPGVKNAESDPDIDAPLPALEPADSHAKDPLAIVLVADCQERLSKVLRHHTR
jgi:hypothetical protein